MSNKSRDFLLSELLRAYRLLRDGQRLTDAEDAWIEQQAAEWLAAQVKESVRA